MPDLKLLLQKMITGWQNENIPILKGADDSTIHNFELKYDVKLPVDMREYFSTVNGMGDHYDDEWFNRLWPIEEVRPASERNLSFVKAFPQSANCFLFFDQSIDLVNYAIRLSDSPATPTPIFRVFDHPDPSFSQHSNSFTEFVALYVNDPAALY